MSESKPTTAEEREQWRRKCESDPGAWMSRHRALRLIADVERLEKSHERLQAMMPLFEEARDAICAIPLASAKLRGLDLRLADRMDDVGIPDRWKARQAALKGASDG